MHAVYVIYIITISSKSLSIRPRNITFAVVVDHWSSIWSIALHTLTIELAWDANCVSDLEYNMKTYWRCTNKNTNGADGSENKASSIYLYVYIYILITIYICITIININIIMLLSWWSVVVLRLERSRVIWYVSDVLLQFCWSFVVCFFCVSCLIVVFMLFYVHVMYVYCRVVDPLENEMVHLKGLFQIKRTSNQHSLQTDFIVYLVYLPILEHMFANCLYFRDTQ